MEGGSFSNAGRHTSGAPRGLNRGGSSPRGATPMTVLGLPASVTVRPSTEGSAPNCRRHRDSLRTTTLSSGLPLASSSKKRPRTGETPSSVKKLWETPSLRTCTEPPSPVMSVAPPEALTASSSKLWLCARQSRKSMGEAPYSVRPASPASCAWAWSTPQMRTSRSGSGKGRGRSSTALRTLNREVFAPIPRARVSSTTRVRPGCRAQTRRPKRRSCHMAQSFSNGRECPGDPGASATHVPARRAAGNPASARQTPWL